MEMISYRPVALPQSRASLISPSLASAPELQKKTRPGTPNFSTSFAASRGAFSL
jgi:hypothetical protein